MYRVEQSNASKGLKVFGKEVSEAQNKIIGINKL